MDLLRRKIHEHISNNPKAKSFIVKASFGKESTHWKVEVKKNKSFNIVEVNTTKSEFVIKETDEKKPDSKDNKMKKQQGAQDIKTDKIVPDSAESGLETNADLTTQQPGAQRTRTSEELHLKQLVDNKPVKDIEVEMSEVGGSVVLHLAGLDNPLKISFEDGRAKYSLGDLSRTLRTSTVGNK